MYRLARKEITISYTYQILRKELLSNPFMTFSTSLCNVGGKELIDIKLGL